MRRGVIVAVAIEALAFASFFLGARAGGSASLILAAVVLSSTGCLVLAALAVGGARARRPSLS